jgi:molybdenum cofactor cytidylyltransferase
VISGVVLAAGTGSRFGGTKQLAELRGRPLVLHAISALRGVTDEIVVITGHDADAVEAVLPRDVRHVRNARFREGLAGSLAVGLGALGESSEAAVVLPADQPGVTRGDVTALVRRFRTTRARIVRLRYTDGPGPALLSRETYAAAGRLSGDAGARVLMASHPDWVEDVDVDRRAPPDVDLATDLERLRRTAVPPTS